MFSSSNERQSDQGVWHFKDGMICDGDGMPVAKMMGDDTSHRLACERILVMANALNGVPTDAIANVPREKGQHVIAALVLRHEKLTGELSLLTESINYHKREIAQLRQTHYIHQAEQASRAALNHAPGAKEYGLLLGNVRFRHFGLAPDITNNQEGNRQ